MSVMRWNRSFRPARLRSGLPTAAFWLGPVLAIGMVYFSPRHVLSVSTAITGLIGLGIVVLAASSPDRSLIALVAFLPFQGFVLSKLWAMGVPTSVVKHLGAWKEALVLGVMLAGARNFISRGERADAVDRLGLAFAGIAALYIVLQHTILPQAPSSGRVRLLGFREDVGLVLLLLGARHAGLPSDFLRRASRVLVGAGAIVGGVCIFEAVDSAAWNHFVVHAVKYTRYQAAVLGIKPPDPADIRFYGTIGGAHVIRSGAFFVNALVCGFYLVLAFAIAMERVVRRAAGPLVVLAMVLIGAGILLTQTRSAILAAVIVCLLAFRATPGRGRHWRAQLAVVIVGLAILAVPAAFASGLADRLQTTTNNQDVSTSGHVAGFWEGVNSIGSHPLGHGLGTSAGTGQRFRTDVVVPENYYLQMGVELGVAPMLIFVALTIAVVVGLRRAARISGDPVAAAAWAAFIGLAVAAWFLQVWNDFSVAWMVWGIAGAAVAVADRRRAPSLNAAAAPWAGGAGADQARERAASPTVSAGA